MQIIPLVLSYVYIGGPQFFANWINMKLPPPPQKKWWNHVKIWIEKKEINTEIQVKGILAPPPLYLDKCTSLGDGITLRRWDPLVLVSPAVTYWRSGEICISWWVLPWVFLIAGYPSVVFLRWQWLSQGGSHWSCWLQIDPSLCYFDGIKVLTVKVALYTTAYFNFQ